MGTPTVVFDTNVFVSGFGFGGKPDACFSLALSDDVELVASTDILHELTIVVEYDRLPFTVEEGHEFAGIVADTARVVKPTRSFEAVDADPDDDKFLECAVAADADYVVSGDSHLLDVGQFRGIPIHSPDAFLRTIADLDAER